MADQQRPLFKRVISRRNFGKRVGVTGLAAAPQWWRTRGRRPLHHYHYFLGLQQRRVVHLGLLQRLAVLPLLREHVQAQVLDHLQLTRPSGR